MNNLSIYPTLIDSFIWYKKIPSPDKFQELIDKINRVKPKEFPILAKKGIQFEDCVNGILDQKQIKKVNGVYISKDFEFDSVIVDKISNKLINHTKKQEYIQCIIDSKIGKIKLYGFVDYSYPESYVDLKTTSNYSYGKFKSNSQHKCYSLISKQNGKEIKYFKYLITNFEHVFVEKYNSNSALHDEFLEEVYQFNDFLHEHKHLITDNKIFTI